jgi:hypothetical protein
MRLLLLFNKVIPIMLSQEMQPTSKIWPILKANKKNVVVFGTLLETELMEFQMPFHLNSQKL